MESFSIEIPDAVLLDLKKRLDQTRLPNQISGIGWQQGTDREYLAQLLDHWRDRYDWRKTEDRLNQFEQLATEIGGQRIHLLHAASTNPRAIPLVLTHGWPSSILEFLDVIGPLRSDFHIVAPSLPGFTFSGPTSQPGWHARRIAAALGDALMQLGYDHYGLQGGDWGSLVCANLADLHPERVVGLHLNMVTAARRVDGVDLSEDEQCNLKTYRDWHQSGGAYHDLQSTRPQSLGYGLEDSPAGLAGWIVEKFHEWSHGAIEEAYTFDRLLDNITAYWVTRTATSSLRIYWELRQAVKDVVPERRIEVPTAVAMFPGEISYPPRSWIEGSYNVVRWTEPTEGGHFAALEAPQVYADDVRSFFLSLLD